MSVATALPVIALFQMPAVSITRITKYSCRISDKTAGACMGTWLSSTAALTTLFNICNEGKVRWTAAGLGNLPESVNYQL